MDFCKILYVKDKQCLVQIVTRERGYGLQFTIEEQTNWLIATISDIPSLEKARELLTNTTKDIASSMVADLLSQYHQSNPS